MKYFLSFLLAFVLLGSIGCKKSSSSFATKVDITVKDAAGAALQNFTVYQMDQSAYNLFGPESFHSEQQSVTEGNGVAKFTIDNIRFPQGNQRTFYYFCNYTIGGTSKTKSVGVTLNQGDTKTATLQLN